MTWRAWRGWLCAITVVACRTPQAVPAAVTPAVSNGDIALGATAPDSNDDRPVRIALTAGSLSGELSATGPWRLYHSGGSSLLVDGKGRGTWVVTRARGSTQLRIGGAGGSHQSATRNGPLVAVPAGGGARSFVMWNGRPYRGVLIISPAPGGEGLLVVNRLGVEDYLRGVVPIELGDVTSAEEAALEAQAVAARSYTYMRLDDPNESSRPFDLVATTIDQAYGGMNVETRLGDAAVEETSGQVLTYGGRVINAPYHSSCGGRTAAASEIWHAGSEPYLQSVSDQIPGTNHYYCEHAAEFRWTRRFSGAELAHVINQYLAHYVSVPGDRPGAVQAVIPDPTTPSGRVAGVTVVTDRGRFHLHGNDVRFVFRSPKGNILNSTAFFMESEVDAAGHVASLVMHGAGNGHGVGMCQWGAIGRARAGQDYRTILATYYPGTVLSHAVVAANE